MRKTVAGVALCSAGCLAIWLLTLSAISTGELVVGSACSLGVGAVVVALWRAVGLRLAPSSSMLRPLLFLPIAIVSDAAQVLMLALRGRVRGSLWEVDTGARASSPEAVTHRALATLGTTVTPASMVLEVDDNGVMTVHALPTRGVHMEERFAKR